jgi:hypothetical protein
MQTITMSPTVGAIFTALAKFQGAVDSVGKDRKGQIGAQRYQYADLPAVMDAIRAPLAKHGLAVVQPATIVEDTVMVRTLIVHESGEWIDCGCCGVPVFEAPKGITLAQARGSAITYLRRYGLQSALGLVADDDDGASAGNAGGYARRPDPQPTQHAPDPGAPIDVEALRRVCASRGVDFAELESDVEKPAGDWLPADRPEITRVLSRLSAEAAAKRGGGS